MGWGGYGRSSGYGGRGGGSASTNWRYLTEQDAQGPRREEIMMSTTYAKDRFALTTSDLASLEAQLATEARQLLPIAKKRPNAKTLAGESSESMLSTRPLRL